MLKSPQPRRWLCLLELDTAEAAAAFGGSEEEKQGCACLNLYEGTALRPVTLASLSAEARHFATNGQSLFHGCLSGEG